ncbi:MAG: hypothetical protein Q7J47_14160 [Azoarcus sp.]|nr:hypothetical protein [Azoarcus sp.]
MSIAYERHPPQLRMHLLDPSGGLGYHWRALRYRHHFWAPFISTVAGWLHAWQPPTKHLVIVGPSAGYALPTPFLARFGQITVLEPDPLARLILRRRLRPLRLEAGTLDCLSDRDGPRWLARQYPDASLLFANILGQAPPLTARPDWAAHLRDALRGHHWASWHDVLSASTAPRVDAATPLLPAPDIATLAGRLWHWPTEVCDHDNFGLVGRQDALALWQLAPHQWQVVEWGIHHPATGLGDPAAG